MSIFAPLDSSANDERPSSSSYSPSPQTRPKISVLNGIDQMDTWSASVVLAFIQAKILGDIAPLKLRCLPQQIKSIVAIEDAHWKRFLDLKVVSELKLMGFHAPLPPVPRCLPPVEMKFVLPDYSATPGTATEKKHLLDAAKALYDKARKLHEAEAIASASQNDAFNAAALTDFNARSGEFVKRREDTYKLLRDTFLHEARLSVWLLILPSLGYNYHRIEETVDFARPAELVAAIELAIYRNRDEEGRQLKQELWASTLATEGRGDPVQYHRYVLLTGRKLESLYGEPVRDSELRQIFTKGLPDDIFLDFKTSLQVNISIKTFNDVNETLKIFVASDTHLPKVKALMRQCERQYSKPVPAGVFLAQTRHVPRAPPTVQAVCFDFTKGKCDRGDGCRFLHSSGADKNKQASSVVTCSHCSKKGHTADACYTLHPDKRPVRMRVKQGVAAAKVARPNSHPNAARAANFLLNIRQNVDSMLLEAEEDEGHAELFAFWVLADETEFPPLPKSARVEVRPKHGLIGAANADCALGVKSSNADLKCVGANLKSTEADFAVGVNCFSSVNHSLDRRSSMDVPVLPAALCAGGERDIRSALWLVESKYDDDSGCDDVDECKHPPLGCSLKRARAKIAARSRLLICRAALQQDALSAVSASQARARAKLLRRKDAKAARRATLRVWLQQLKLHALYVNPRSLSSTKGLSRRVRAQAAFLVCKHVNNAVFSWKQHLLRRQRKYKCFFGEQRSLRKMFYLPRFPTKLCFPSDVIFASPDKKFFTELPPVSVAPHLLRYPLRARSPERRASMRFRFENLSRVEAADGVSPLSDVVPIATITTATTTAPGAALVEGDCAGAVSPDNVVDDWLCAEVLQNHDEDCLCRGCSGFDDNLICPSFCRCEDCAGGWTTLDPLDHQEPGETHYCDNVPPPSVVGVSDCPDLVSDTDSDDDSPNLVSDTGSDSDDDSPNHVSDTGSDSDDDADLDYENELDFVSALVFYSGGNVSVPQALDLFRARSSFRFRARSSFYHSFSPTTSVRASDSDDAAVGEFQAAPAAVLSTTAVFMNTVEVVLGITGVNSNRVLVDSGASIHATPRKDLCFDIVPCSVSIAGVGGVAFRCVERGSLVFQPNGDGRAVLAPVVLEDVHISLEFPTTFISESKLVRKGSSVLKSPSGGQVTNDDGLMFRLCEEDGLYYADGSLVAPPAADALRFGVDDLPDTPFLCQDVPAALCWLDKCDLNVCEPHEGGLQSLLLAKTYTKRDTSDLLGRYHRRMSHMSFRRVAAAFGVELPANFEPPLCNACVMGKQKNIPHHEGACLRANRPCAGLHIDFCGPFPHVSRHGSRYLLIFKCDYTGFVWDFYTKSQSEFFDILVALIARLSNQFSLVNVVVWIRSDNGKVFTERQVAAFCLAKGIRHEFSAPYSQWQNGSAERMFQTILNLSVASLHQSGFCAQLLGGCCSVGCSLHQ